jgi:hypothetical protein
MAAAGTDAAAAGRPGAERPVDGEPVAERPVDGEPVAGEPVAGESGAERPVDGEPAAERGADLVGVAVDRWSRFWFRPEPMTALALVRILFGLVMVAWSFALLPNLLTFLGRGGILPNQPSSRYAWGPLQIWHSDQVVIGVWALLLIASAALTVGWHSRVAAVCVFVCMMSVLRRDTYIFNAGDGLLRIEALFLALAPCGSALSLDRRRTAGSFWDSQVRAPWVIRLMQVQVSIIYLATVRAKLSGATWNEGTAVSYALRLPDLRNFPVPGWLTTNALLMNAATWGTLVVEIAIGVLVWNRRLRPWVLGAGVLLHLSILLTLAVGFFSWTVWILYLAFVPPQVAQRWVDRARARLRRRPAGPERTDRPADSHQVVLPERAERPDPAERSEPAGLPERSKPAELSEPAGPPERSKPAGLSEPAALPERSEPAELSEPAGPPERSKPPGLSEPAGLPERSKPPELSEPAGLPEAGELSEPAERPRSAGPAEGPAPADVADAQAPTG